MVVTFDFRTERKEERERKSHHFVVTINIDLLFHSCMHSLVDSCMCPERELNLQPWCIGAIL